MFHPTVFDNIKIAFENQLYDYDNLDGILTISGRTDLLNLAVMSREFTLAFKLTDGMKVTSEVVLRSSVKELSEEIMETPDSDPGCSLLLRFYMEVTDTALECPAIERVLTGIWGPELKPEQSKLPLWSRGTDLQQLYTAYVQAADHRGADGGYPEPADPSAAECGRAGEYLI